MGKKRSDRGAEGTGCRPGDPHGDSERSRAWEVDLVARCWLICHCAYVPGPGRPGLCLSFFRRELCFFGGDEKHGNRSASRRGTAPLFSQMSLPEVNLASEICHLL